MVRPAEIIGERLDATVVNMRFVKPLDEELVMRLAGTHTALVTLEENAIAGGAGSAVLELLAGSGGSLPSLTLGIPDQFIEHGSRENCLAEAGLDLPGLESAVRRWWEQLTAAKKKASGT
jgi:1-deoxy-D-xylulose-5-phosphate synthase